MIPERFMAALIVVVLLAGASRAAAEAGPAEGGRSIPEGIEIEQRLDEPLPLDAVFRDEAGGEVRLGEYFGDRPVIIAPVYYECPMLCTLVLNGLVRTLRSMELNVGEDFEVVTFSFDPAEGPELATAKKETYVNEYERSGAAAGWHFLTGERESIARLTRALGFGFEYNPTTDEYAHAASIVVATPQGRISHYFFGVEYAARDLRLALVESGERRIGTVVDQLLLLCYRYDPSTGRYSAAVMNILRLGGLATVLALGSFMIIMFRREKRHASSHPSTTSPNPPGTPGLGDTTNPQSEIRNPKSGCGRSPH